jgi:transposase-like protein
VFTEIGPCASGSAVWEGIDPSVLSLSARGLTTGEIAAHFADVYGATVSTDTISRITDAVVEQMAEWRDRLLDRRVYPVVFIDAIVCHEPLCDRVEVRDLHRLAVAAVG